ncbi:MAG: hypothetical protein IJW58_03975, partial [Clostridia bacterium]|nr:hypothetical protein [Clostridia bacterium]
VLLENGEYDKNAGVTLTYNGVQKEYTQEEFTEIKDSGILVIPTKLLDGEELTIGVNGYVKTVYPDMTLYQDKDVTYYFQKEAYIYNIDQVYYDLEYSCRAYFVDEETTVYTPMDEKSERTVSEVAILAKYAYDTQTFDENDNPTEIVYGNAQLARLYNYLPVRTTVSFPNTEKYLYRVGNMNEFALTSLLDVKYAEINTGACDVSATGVELTYNEETGKYQFRGTGIATLTITDKYSRSATEITADKITKDYEHSVITTLKVEVVDAYNVIQYNELENRNSVLLNDIVMTHGSYYLSNATLYGNGFSFDVTKGDYTSGGNLSSNYVVCLSNASLDNVKIVGAVYTSYGATVSDNYNRATVLSTGDNKIINCCISNCATPVRLKDGNLEIVSSTLKGGNYANLDIRNGNVVLDKVTTINQLNGNDTATDGTVVLGLGIVVYYENVNATTSIEIKNGITQYNYLSQSQANQYIKDSNATTLVSAMFKSEYADFQYNSGSDVWVNTGIISMSSDSVGDSNISDVNGYQGKTTTFNVGLVKYNGYVYTKTPTATSVLEKPSTYEANNQGVIAPSYSFDFTTINYQAKVDGSNDYCYYENGKVVISMDDGDTFNWKTSILTVNKHNKSLDYTVSMNGVDYTNQSISFDTAGNYVVVYTYVDPYNYTTSENSYSITYTKELQISVSIIKKTTKHAEFTFGSSETSSKEVEISNGDGSKSTYVMPNVNSTSSTIGSTTVNGTTIYYPIVEIIMSDGKTSHTSAWYAYFPVLENVITITDYKDNGNGDAETFGGSTQSMPSGLSVDGDPTTLFKYQSGSSAEGVPVVKNNILVYSSPSISKKRDEYNTLIKYSYEDNAGTTYYYYVGYHAPAQSYTGCLVEGTLITLADGTQKKVEDLTYNDQLLVFNHYTGKMETGYIAMLDHLNEEPVLTNVINLKFSNGKILRIVWNHGLFDVTLNEYVFIGELNYQDFVGHKFYSTAYVNGEFVSEIVVLENAYITEETVRIFNPTTLTHMNYFAEGILNVTAAPKVVSGHVNYFELDETMKYDEEKMQADIEKYGMYMYDDFKDLLTEEEFNALPFKYLKVSVAKGLINWEGILAIIDYLHTNALM